MSSILDLDSRGRADVCESPTDPGSDRWSRLFQSLLTLANYPVSTASGVHILSQNKFVSRRVRTLFATATLCELRDHLLVRVLKLTILKFVPTLQDSLQSHNPGHVAASGEKKWSSVAADSSDEVSLPPGLVSCEIKSQD